MNEEHCVMCDSVIPEGRQVCPICEKAIKPRMQWVQVAFCDWEAKGSEGDFRVWKDGRIWRGRYRSVDHKKHFFLPSRKTEKEMKNLCEDNFFWED